MIRVEAKTATVYYTTDGSTPDGTVGNTIAAGSKEDLPCSPPVKLYSATGAAEVTFWK